MGVAVSVCVLCIRSIQVLNMESRIFSISMVNIHILLSCKAVCYQMQPWNWVCMSPARTAKHLAENPFHILKGWHSPTVPWLLAQMPPRLFAAGWSARGGDSSPRVSMPWLPVGVTVTMWQSCCLLLSTCSGWVSGLSYIISLSSQELSWLGENHCVCWW